MTCWRTLGRSAPKTPEHQGGDTFPFAHDAEEKMLGPYVVVTELESFTKRELHDLLGPRREWGRPGSCGAREANRLLDHLPHAFERHLELLKGLGGHSFTLFYEAEQDVFGPDEGMVEQTRLFLGEDEDLACAVGESLERASSFALRRDALLGREKLRHLDEVRLWGEMPNRGDSGARQARSVSTISRLQGQRCETLLGTLPSMSRFTPLMPRFPTTTRSAPTA